MVNIIENWAQVEGVVKSLVENPTLSGYTLVNLDMKVSAEVKSFPNLAKPDEGKTIRINVLTGDIGERGIRPGVTLSCTVRKAHGQIYFIK